MTSKPMIACSMQRPLTLESCSVIAKPSARNHVSVVDRGLALFRSAWSILSVFSLFSAGSTLLRTGAQPVASDRRTAPAVASLAEVVISRGRVALILNACLAPYPRVDPARAKVLSDRGFTDGQAY